MKIRSRSLASIVLLLLGLAPLGADAADDQSDAQKTPQERRAKLVIYPILIQAPIFGATVDVPSVPGDGGDGAIGGSGSTDAALNAAYMGGVEFDAQRVFGEVDFLWTKPSASRTTPTVDVTSTIWLVTARGGYRFYRGLAVTGGARRLSLDLNTTLQLPDFGVTLRGQSSRVVWDPFVGIDWRRYVNKELSVSLGADAGGFGVGADSDFHLHARADWQPARHLSIRAGYEMFHFDLTLADVSIGALQRSLNATQTLHGPEIGVGIVF